MKASTWRSAPQRIGAAIALASVLSIAPDASGANLIANGDFSSGNTGFQTNYTFSPGDLLPEQTYDIVTNPSDSHPSAASFFDHTTGTGNMMAVNGGSSPVPVVWSQSVEVEPGTTYDFSLWVASWYPTNPARLRVLINSVPVAPDFSAPSSATWVQFAATWDSGFATTAIISITDQTAIASGNDFALDDISLAARQGPRWLPMFTGLGDLPGGDFDSGARAISADGRVAVGASQSAPSSAEAFRWDGGVMSGLGDLPGSGLVSAAFDTSSDGAVVVGRGQSAVFDEAFRWESGVMTGLGDLGGGFGSEARGVSANGVVVVGWASSLVADGDDEAFRWAGVMTGLGFLGGFENFFASRAWGVSSDGLVIVGSSTSANGECEAFRWEAGVMVGLGDLPGGEFSSLALAVSGDGSVVVGEAMSASGREAVRWDGSIIRSLGELPGGSFGATALDVNADGSIIVGQGNSDEGVEAWIWDSRTGMRELDDVLTEFGLDLTGWTLQSASGISSDGRTIVGTGFNPSGDREAWIAVIPPPQLPSTSPIGVAILASLLAGAACWKLRAR